MSLMNCPQCGKEISDKAKRCPQCGAEFEKKKDQDDTSNKLESISNNNREGQLISENVGKEKQEDKQEKHRKKIFLIISILVLIVIGIGGYILYGKLSADPLLFMTDEDKIDQYIPKFIGEMDETHTIETPLELMDIIENGFELFGVDGLISGSYTDEGDERGIADIVIWTSKDKCGETDKSHALDVLNEIYGQSTAEGENLEIVGRVIPTYVQWSSDEYDFIVCGMNDENKLTVVWYANLNETDESIDEESGSMDEEIGSIDEYEGVFSKEAEEYQSIAESLFLDELEQTKKELTEAGGGGNYMFEWGLIGSFEKNTNYYYLYTYTDENSMDIDHHILIKVDPSSSEAENVTPLQWIEDEVKQLDNIWS